MKLLLLATAVAMAMPFAATAGEQLKAEDVPPAIRAACEQDVRRLCASANPTIEGVKTCVAAKFRQLGKRCQIQLALAGFSR